MKILNNNDKVSAYLWDKKHGYMQNRLLSDFELFSGHPTKSGLVHSQYINIGTITPVYIPNCLEDIRERMLDDVLLHYEPSNDRSYMVYIINDIKLLRAENGLLEAIIFPLNFELAKIFNIPDFGHLYDIFNGFFTGDWLAKIYEHFLRVLSTYIISGEIIYTLDTNYHVGMGHDDPLTEYTFCSRHIFNHNMAMYYASPTYPTADGIYKNLTHRFVNASIPTRMDLYNVF